MKEEVDIDLNDPDVEDAAFKIQAGFKGMKARKEVSQMKATASSKRLDNQEETSQPEFETTEDEEKKKEKLDEGITIDINDPDLEEAATKIQAGFKEMKTRKEIASHKEETEISNIELLNCKNDEKEDKT